MKRPLAVVDTNVLVSGLLTADSEAPTSRILDSMLAGQLAFLLSPELLAEYRRVLLRPKIRRLHGLSEVEIDSFLTEIAANGIVRDPPRTAEQAPDPGDAHLWDLVAAFPESVLITGDQLLLQSPPHRGSALSPRNFWNLRLAPS